MSNPWDAERVVAPAEAAQLIDTCIPDLAPAQVEPLGVGWDNTAFRVNGDLVFRFPRRSVAAPLLQREIGLLPALAQRVPLPIPVPHWVGGPTEEYPWRFAGYRRLEGVPATTAALNVYDRGRAAQPLAAFLAALHTFPADEAAALGAPPDELHRTDIFARRDRTVAALEGLAAAGLLEELDEAVAILDATPPPRALSVLVHGDLYASHLLVDGERRLAGVIDWGDVHLGDPATDLGGAIGFLPPRAFETFLAAYGPVDAVTLRLARFRALYHSTNLVRYARDVGDGELLREALTALANAMS